MMKIKYCFTFALTIVSHILFSQKAFYGVTTAGGNADIGTIFTLDSLGQNHQVLYSFPGGTGTSPYSSVLAGNGKIYGLTSSAGLGLYEFDPVSKKIEVLNRFKNVLYNSNNSSGYLINTSGNILYGYKGRNPGILFKYDINTKTYTELHSFLSMATGIRPTGPLVLASDGYIYGMAESAQTSNWGVAGRIYRYHPVLDTIEPIFDVCLYFNPGGMIEASDGNIYGTYSCQDSTTYFSYNLSNGVFSVVKKDTLGPITHLIEVPGNKLFGTRADIVYPYQPGSLIEWLLGTDSIINKFHFDTLTGFAASGPLSYHNGKIYGATQYGSQYYSGMLFEFDLANQTFNSLFDFQQSCTYGCGLEVYLDTINSRLMGISTYGGTYGIGSAFEYNLNTQMYQKHADFTIPPYGAVPFGNLVAKDNLLIGVTMYGGFQNSGVLYAYNQTTQSMDFIWEFSKDTIGYRPSGDIMMASDGNIYGITQGWRPVLYRYNPNNNEIMVACSFEDSVGLFPDNGLVETNNGKLYGLTSSGGLFGYGTIYEFDLTTQAVQKVYDTSPNYGKGAIGSLTLAPNGRLYGRHAYPLNSSNSSIFEFDPITKSYLLHLNNWLTPDFNTSGKLTVFGNSLYGTAMTWSSTNGIILEFNILTNVYSFPGSFSDSTGNFPSGALTVGPNGNLYGLTSRGGSYNYGTVYEFDVTNQTITKVLDFDGANGRRPLLTSLIVANAPLGLRDLAFDKPTLTVYPNPANETLTVSGKEIMKVEIRDLSGNLVGTYCGNREENLQLGLQHLSSGMYILIVQTSSGVETRKVVKE